MPLVKPVQRLLKSKKVASAYMGKGIAMSHNKNSVNKVVLAYSGGLDTSVILKWLQTEYECEVVTYTADLGQGEELGPARDKALKLGIKEENIFIDDVREEFVRDFVFPMFRANACMKASTCWVQALLAFDCQTANRNREPGRCRCG